MVMMDAKIMSDALTRALNDLAAGRPVILTGARDGGPVMVQAAGAVDDTWVNFMAREARGLLGMAITPRRASALGLSLQPRRNVGRPVPLYTLSIEAAVGCTTGISAGERATTVAAAAVTPARPEAVVTPGHIFPQVSEIGTGGQAEGALDLLRRAGVMPVAMICSMLDFEGRDADDLHACTVAATLDLAIVDMGELGLV
ncbi:3,4-dihydroxy-2-butanone 4-phosphate synthase [Aquimixticola soesokkakensis]|uniref:3,4-dihydroxy-2-butanone 4-phosphate synthase n=1 Tax=Aquimixticola soesokkakensis TaxID=1519096 RepID=A0A1Y5TA34_9RHOB|nr:3,4-dihydroxy-2-butanone-4-phosphate synthase [Aquimixticola soesokkakensis]SLN57313.1 3,4-dihydroxy-2-butanone 4-phosphate synthase [Aquimixticola soesokkakensis]